MTGRAEQKSDQMQQVERIVNAARAALAGHPAEVQGAALADLLATWLAGHIIPNSPSETQFIHERLLKIHVEMVRKLIPVNAEQIHGKGATP